MAETGFRIGLGCLLAASAWAGEGISGKPARIENVETLVDRAARLAGSTVMVPGEVENLLSTQAFVLEGGGILNDEVVVVMSRHLDQSKRKLVSDDADLMVTGKVRRVTVGEIERELGSAFDPQIKARLRRVDTFLVAEDIRRQAE